MNVAAEAVLLLVAATLCATAAADRRALRTTIQAGLVGAGAFMVWAGDARPVAVAFVGVVLVVVAALATNLAGGFRRAGEAERAAREAAERRTELLDAVRALPELDLRAAAQVTTAALRALGARAAGVAIVREGRVVPVDLNGVPATDRLLRVGEGVAGRTVVEGRTLVIHDYQDLPERFDHLPELRSTVSAPIRIGDEVVGAIMAAQGQAGPPTAGEVEVIEVLAAHLGAVLTTRRQLDNQRTLLERMDRLEAMRRSLVEEVSDELRDPLTIIRGAAEAMQRHGEALDVEDRRRLLQRLNHQADALRRIVDTLLDFSRVQASQREPSIQHVSLQELFATFGGRLEFDDDASLDLEVAVDVSLARYAIELLIGAGSAYVEVQPGDRAISVGFSGQDPERPSLVRSLVAQLAVNAGAALHLDDVLTMTLPRAGAVTVDDVEVAP